ncbi:hypothetical protein VSH64_45720 [Amycolatopsis rhabdoformis]|uniref:Symplekin/Pta1 N-terminal domain-containing protein n=1 Tax=Amycolatopsis rhabdoformis TaxID=1448059 RepID=A0ABZ1I868_9PSEU|nr:hypothetical protein [Amycolatopsis rhabdoformis]WSE30017.1 hypothetical protein VSH64_45720 [Amycolatopsis rhabdoformis]
MELRRKADEAWISATQRNNRPLKSTYAEKSAAIDATVAEIIEQLAREHAHHPRVHLRKARREAAGQATEERESAVENESRRTHLETPIERDRPGETPGPPTSTAHHPAPQLRADGGHGQPTAPPRSTVEEIERLGNALTDVVLKDIEKVCGGSLPEPTKVALADHFWCDLLAQFAHVIDEGAKFFDDIPDRVTKLILASRTAPRRLPLEEIVVKTAVKSMWNLLQPLAAPLAVLTGFKKLLPVIRLLAVLICKAPERHEAVVTYCVDPLTKSLTDAVKKRLVKALSSWLPGLMDEVGPAAA